MQARLQVWSGSSMSTTGTRRFPAHQFLACHFIMSVAMCSGYRIEPPAPSVGDGGCRLRPADERLHPRGENGSHDGPELPLGDACLPAEPDRRRPEPRTGSERGERAARPEIARRRIDRADERTELLRRAVEHDAERDEWNAAGARFGRDRRALHL